MKPRSIGLSLFLATLLAAGPSLAADVASEVRHFREVFVSFSPDAAQCGLSEADGFKQRVAQDLNRIGITQNVESPVIPVLFVTAEPAGEGCAVFASLELQAILEADFVTITSMEEKRQLFEMISERERVFPVTFYRTGELFMEHKSSTPQRTQAIIDQLVGNLAAARR